MSKLEKIQDEDLRKRLDEAHGLLRSGKATDAVHTLADTFVDMLERYPQLWDAQGAARRGRRMPIVARWPALGANMPPDAVRERQPRIEYTREKFAISEAITYYEFTVDTAIQQGL